VTEINLSKVIADIFYGPFVEMTFEKERIWFCIISTCFGWLDNLSLNYLGAFQKTFVCRFNLANLHVIKIL